MSHLKSDEGALQSVAQWIARETVETWEQHLRKGQEALVRSHTKSFSGFVQEGIRLPDRPVTEQLSGLLNDDDRKVRHAGIEALGEIGLFDSTTRDALLDQLEEADPNMRQQVARVFGEKSISDPIILEILADWVHDSHRKVRKAATRALGKIGTGNSEVLEALLGQLDETRTSHPFDAERPSEVAAWAIRQIDVAEPLTETLFEQLKENPREMSSAAMKTLGWAGGSNPAVIEAMLDLLDKGVMPSTVAEAIGEAVDSELSATKSLTEWLEDQSWRSRGYAAMALGEIGVSNASVLQKLHSQLVNNGQLSENEEIEEEEKAWICIHTIEALGKIGCPKPEVVREIRRFLSLQSDGLRKKATEALGRIGASNPQVVRDFALEEHIQERLKDRDPFVREAAAEALAEIVSSTPTVVDGLIDRLEVEESFAFRKIARALCNIGVDDPRAREVLIARLDDQESTVRYTSAETLGKIGGTDRETTQALIDLLDDERWNVRCAAAKALGEIGAMDPPVVENLARLMNDGSLHVDEAAAKALGKLAATDLTSLRSLANHLLSGEKPACREAGRAFARLPWCVISESQINEEVQAYLTGERRDWPEAQRVYQTEDGEHIIVHWQALARLPE
jgi:HEAT repeat protein